MILSNQHEMQWSSATPGLLIFLLDQNVDDQQQPLRVTDIINVVIDRIINLHCDGYALRSCCFISVIGYNHNVRLLFSSWLIDFHDNPVRFEIIKKMVPDGVGGFYEVEVKRPVWVEPIAQDGATNMLGALQLAKDLAEKWIIDNPDGPAPVIINISNGVPNYDGKDICECMKECQMLAKEIMKLSCADGNICLYNATLKSSSLALENNLLHLEIEEFIYSISSVTPSIIMENIKCAGLELPSTMNDGYIYSEHMAELFGFIYIIQDEIFRRRVKDK